MRSAVACVLLLAATAAWSVLCPDSRCVVGSHTYTYREGATGCGNTHCGAQVPDVYLDESDPFSNKEGVGLVIGGGLSGLADRTILQFDVSDIPTAATLVSATLTLTAYSVEKTPTAGHICRLRRTDWVDTQATWTWYQADGINPPRDWTLPGASDTTSDVDSPGAALTACMPFAGVTSPGVTTFDVTNLTRDAVRFRHGQLALRFAQDDETNTAFWAAYDSDVGTGDQKPTLTVVFFCGTTTTTTTSDTTTSTSSTTTTVTTSTSTSSSSTTAASTSTSTSTTESTSTSTSTSTTTTTGGGTTTTLGFVQDTFERGSLGANWTTGYASLGSCIITGSSDLSVSAIDFNALCYWNANSPSSSSEYACALLSGQGEGESGVCLGMDSSGNAACCATWDDGIGGQYWTLSKYINAVFTGFLDTGVTPHFVTGDYIGIERTSATAFRCYRSTTGDSWTALGSGATTIASIPDPGAWGAQVNNDAGVNTPFMLEVWEGGNGTLPTGHVCGTP